MPTRPLLLAASLADRRPTPDHGELTRRARVAERAGLDLVVLEDGPFDPLLVAARLAAQTVGVGIAPVTATTTTEPFHVSTALSTIDVVARGRAGWVLAVEAPDDVRGTVTWEVPDDVHGDAAEHLDAVRALWDSWEDGAVIRDVATDRFLDRDRVHHVDVEGRFLAVRGPSITPRPPQGHLPVLVRVTDAPTLGLAERHADALLTVDPRIARGTGAPGGPVRLLELQVDPAGVGELAARLADEHAAGVDGVVLHAEDLDGTLAVLVPALEAAGVRAAPASVPEPDPTGEHPSEVPPTTLRERLGLPAATNRFEVSA